MAKDRARDIKRSVGSHEKMMGALGRAAASTSDVNSAIHWVKPESVRKVGSATSNIDKQRAKGLITDKEAGVEKLEIAAKEGRTY